MYFREVRHEGDSTLQLISTPRFLELIASEAVNPAVESSLNWLKLMQCILVSRELFDRAVADVINKAIAHCRDPDKLVTCIAAGNDIVFVASVSLSADALLDEPIKQIALECKALEPQQREDRVLVFFVGLGKEQLDNFKMLLGLLSIKSAKFQVNGLDLGLGC